MIGSLLRNESEFTVSCAVVMPNRRKVVDFNVYINAWKFVAIYRTPNSNHDRLACLRPFDERLWFAILAIMISLTLILLIATSSFRIFHIEDFHGDDSIFVVSAFRDHVYHRFIVSDCIFWPVNLLCAKAVYRMPRNFPVRIPLFAGSLAGLVFNVAYSGTLISFLSIAMGSFKRFDQLLESGFTFDTKAVIQYEMLNVSRTVIPFYHDELL